ncbi:SusC/RagA family TonB-linked outer membrane protein [Sphingobacterium wenxiniae]|uniref:TonB-linked outer membrane protein, SusC/RagA family n=1 Tax=Sphingobacterium wenxiniae TaxID=683125 RepID=A0A1I6Q3S1_9SPHI|nr:TonB-dependent receptor [Sphingobacterium wenxiniae]SFS47073.1 TonB-linked outer membrane protein, SusC/RagA family [Sphingobacterium wenxiniae]
MVSILVLILLPGWLWAQNQVSGVVTGSSGFPISGVSVVVVGSSPQIATSTDEAGRYSLQAPTGAVLRYTFVGYQTREEPVGTRTQINVSLEEDESTLDEVVVVGYGTQKKVTLTGAVSGVKGTEMRATKNENPQNMLAGRVAGVRVWQRGAEPGSYQANFDIRGMGAPLVIIDGVPRSIQDFQRLNPNDIEDVSVLKDASASIYGVRSANGVMLVTTRKGREGKVSVGYNGSFTMQRPSNMPFLADAFGAMTLYNERSMNNINGGSLIYTESDFEAFRNGTRRSSDWTSLIFSEVSPQTAHDLSVSGGSAKTQYYIGTGYSYQEGFFKTGDLNYNKMNLRSNITTEIVNGLKLDLNLAGMADQQNNPYSSSVDIIRNYWRQGVLFPAYADPEGTMLNYEGLDLEQNTVAMIDADISGYRKYKKKTFQSSAALNYDFGTLMESLKGLSARALVSYDYRADNNSIFRKEYFQYALDPVSNSYLQKRYDLSSPNRMRREFYEKQQILSQITLNYERLFAEKHQLSMLLGWETQKNDGDNFYGMKNLAFGSDILLSGVEEGRMTGMSGGLADYYREAKQAALGRVNYDFRGRYIAEFQFRYDGSSRFAKGNQWGFFPSGSVAWRISEEPFFKSINALSFVDQFKVRASYGVLGDDLSSDWDFGWVAGYDYPSTSGNAENGYYNQYAPGYVFGGQFITAANRKAIANALITWYRAKTLNVGVDMDAWNGKFGFTLDYFDRRRTGLFQRRTGLFPTVIGATAPMENANSDQHYGLELELRHRNQIGDFGYSIKTIATITRNKYLTAVQNGPYKNSYDRWRNDNLNNRYQGIQFGYRGDGRFMDWNDIRTYPIYTERDQLPGDYKYVDWNGDGEISGLDEHPFAFDQTPWLNFSANLQANYKNVDLSMLFQGSALGSMEYKEPLYSIWGTNGGGTLTQYLDRWHPVDPTADPYDPSIAWVQGHYGFTGRYPRGNSDFNRVSTAYLRLKSLELGYTLPTFQRRPNMRLRVFANAYNLLTFTAVKFVDPEHPDDDLGRMYPLNKTYTMGVSMTF